jgi:UPF0755 protein
MKKALGLLSVLGFLFLAAAVGGYLDLMAYADRPASVTAGSAVITVARGQSFSKIAAQLYADGLITHPLKLRLLARLNGAETRIQAGEYLLSSGMSPAAILETMVSGKVRLLKFTVPEGANLRQIADIVAAAGLSDGTAFLQAAMDPDLTEAMGVESDTFEGYLFPETYFFPRNATPHDIISVMVERFRSVFTDDWRQRCAEIGMTVHEVVTLASIVEKETGAPEERPLIASVFHNRLHRGMRLQTDPTVIYGIEAFDGNLTRKHLETPTPYNTYTIRGLPPGPIASPGRAALEAVLYPARTNYLYFVSRKDGTHQFSTNLRDHNRAIGKYQLRR